MKTLVLVRHAKSSWSDPSLDDFDRPLNKRGERNAPEMGRRLGESGLQPDIFVSSPANRARSTAEIIAKELDYPADNIIYHGDLYHASPGDLLEAVRSLGDNIETAFLFGHNPGITSNCSSRIRNMRILHLKKNPLEPVW